MRSLAELKPGETAEIASLKEGSAVADLGMSAGEQVLVLRRVGSSTLHVRLEQGLECGVSLDLAAEVLLR